MSRVSTAVTLFFLLVCRVCPAAPTEIPPGIHLSKKAAHADFGVVATVLAEELAQRTGQAWGEVGHGGGIRLEYNGNLGKDVFEVVPGADGALTIFAGHKRGALFGAGHLLRHLAVRDGRAHYVGGADPYFESPAKALRGHQLGYRQQANSYDAWTVAQFDQYIRELALFGTNMIENIPFQDDRPSPLMPISRRDMNRAMSEICAKYGLEYWVWTPADFDLTDRTKAEEQLRQYAELYADCPELSGVFFPAGDPGDNPPSLVLPYLAEVAVPLRKHHPNAKIWISLQGFSANQCGEVYDWIRAHEPTWLGGLVAGPSAPPIQGIRRQLPPQYGLRDYPDITHTVRCQFPVPWWDPALALTLGRECITVRPKFFANVFRFFDPFIDGFGTYSDGMHDDVNKIVYSRLGCVPGSDVRGILTEYARFFFGDAHATSIADGLLAFERDWEGSLADNANVNGTLAVWQALEKDVPALSSTWRGQMFLTLAEYHVYTRNRLLAETAQEKIFNAHVSGHSEPISDAALDRLLALLEPVPTEAQTALRHSLVARFDYLFKHIGLQSSVEKYQASGTERGCSLELLDYPLNNRWWIADEFAKIRALPVAERAEALERIATWEDPGPGGFYDDLGHPGRSPHVVRALEVTVEPDLERAIVPTQWWWDSGKSRQRLSWQTTMDWPAALRYDGLDAKARYVLRLTGYGKAFPVADGFAMEPIVQKQEIGEISEYLVPPLALEDRRIEITFRRPTDEGHLNWRQQSRASEVWLVKQP